MEYSDLVKAVQQRMRELGLNRIRLSERMGFFCHTRVTKYLNEEKNSKNPTFETLQKFASALELPLSELMARAEKNHRENLSRGLKRVS